MNVASYAMFGYFFGVIYGFCEEMWKKITLIVLMCSIVLFFIGVIVFSGGEFISDNPSWWGIGLELIFLWIGMFCGGAIAREVKA